jgi:hypothetical protein
VTPYAITFCIWPDQMGEFAWVRGVATQAFTLGDRFMNLTAGDRMLNLVVAGDAHFSRVGEHCIGSLDVMTFRADVFFPCRMSLGGFGSTALAATVADGVGQQKTVAREVRVVTFGAPLERGLDVVWACENLRFVVAGCTQIPWGLGQ